MDSELQARPNVTGAYIYSSWVCESQQGLTFSPLIAGDVGRYEDGRCAICEKVESRCRWVDVSDTGVKIRRADR